MTDTPSDATDDRELLITRVFDAPREVVFQAWTDPDQLARWMGPKGFTTSVVTSNLTPGGRWRFRIVQDDGDLEFWAQGVYQEIVPPQQLVFTFAWEEERELGNETVVTISLADVGGKTEMTFHQAFFLSVEDRDNHVAGWTESFDDLTAYLRL